MSKDSNSYHLPVLLEECLDSLNPREDGTYLDGTLGGGGHSSAILRCLGPQGHLICLDRDAMAIAEGQKQLEKLKSPARLDIVQENFGHVTSVLQKLGVSSLDAALLDIGVSSAQLDLPQRGFSYMEDGPLDMRMDDSKGISAQELLGQASEAELCKILWDYGEERYARRIAAAIVRTRQHKPLTRTQELVEVIYRAIPHQARREKQHPAKRSFQALRIAVNDELGELERFLAQIPLLMRPQGKLLIISFHSLEDRLVKQAMRKWEDPCTCPPSFPVCQCGRLPLGQAQPRKGIRASDHEIAENPRARSARLRVFCFDGPGLNQVQEEGLQ